MAKEEKREDSPPSIKNTERTNSVPAKAGERGFWETGGVYHSVHKMIFNTTNANVTDWEDAILRVHRKKSESQGEAPNTGGTFLEV